MRETYQWTVAAGRRQRPAETEDLAAAGRRQPTTAAAAAGIHTTSQ